MIKIKTTIVLSTLMLLTSCKSKGQICDTKNYKELNLTPVNSILKIPPYDITDTIRYGDLNNIFKREVHSLDSSIVIFAGIKSYVKDSSAMPDILHRMGSQKEQVEAGQNSLRLLTQKFRTINTTTVGYLKYLDEKRNRYESRIFFYRGMNFVDIWLYEKCKINEKDKLSVIDCIFDNIQIN